MIVAISDEEMREIGQHVGGEDLGDQDDGDETSKAHTAEAGPQADYLIWQDRKGQQEYQDPLPISIDIMIITAQSFFVAMLLPDTIAAQPGDGKHSYDTQGGSHITAYKRIPWTKHS